MSEQGCCIADFGGCCCTCANRVNDYSHPCVDGKSILIQRGYICSHPELGHHSGWSEHGMCECYRPRSERPDHRFAAEVWDRRYGVSATPSQEPNP